MEKELLTRLESAVARLEVLSVAPPAPKASSRGISHEAVLDPSISALDDLVSGFLGRVLEAAGKIGGEVLHATKVVEEAFSVLKLLIVESKHCQNPGVAGMAAFLKPLNNVIAKANYLTEGKRSEYFNHLKAVADGLTALAWIGYTGKDCGMRMPITHVEESWQMAEFYSNKILVEYKNKEPEHINWAKSLKELYLPGLRDYVKNFYPLGPAWGTSVSVLPSSSSSLKAPTSNSPSAPPPPTGPLISPGTVQSRPREGMSAVFEAISSGQSVTAGLRKVTDDMKSKNRVDRTGVVVSVEKGTRASSITNTKVSSKLELQMGRKWAVENHIGNKNLIIEDCDTKQSVYIYGCKDSVLQVKGKVNNITVDKCTKMGVLFTEVVAAFEIVNCNGVEVQCQCSAPTISIDNTSGCQLYLSSDSLGASITTAKSSDINVLVPGAGPDNDWVEHPLPQQFIHAHKDGQFTTSPVCHSGA
ncbi:cyclase-associated protein 1-like [Zingiber officinale]|uniref:cyclase-associated protein 1-like n=1 Tax=Zingiber officinale TaxID=94328 RepID=UPI001C4ACE83|nr:cyclase-associated protein 1-like [Zingiber officinale]